MGRMDPQIIVSNLLATNLTQAKLAELVPCSQSLISSLITGARGKRISKNIGDRLEELHAELCPAPPEPKRPGRKPQKVPD